MNVHINDWWKKSLMLAWFYVQDSQWALTVEGMKGLQSIAKQKLHRVREMMALARQCYLKVLTGAENVLPIFTDVFSDSDSGSDLEDLEWTGSENGCDVVFNIKIDVELVFAVCRYIWQHPENYAYNSLSSCFWLIEVHKDLWHIAQTSNSQYFAWM